ncbi:MAG: EMC3/TMCO1 family protein [Nitrososphaerales archaeon]
MANRTISAKFGTTPLPLNGTCTTNSAGGLSGCSFVVPKVAHGAYTVTVSDGTNSPTAAFTIPVITIPESTLLVTMTSVGLSLVTQLVTRRVVNLNAERRMKAEVSAFNKEKRAATLAKDKAKLEKLKKRELPMRQEQAKVSSSRLKVTAITFVPLLGVYYLMASFLGGFNVVVAYSPIPIPLLVGTNGIMALFWWYMLSSFTFSSLLTKALHTTT